MKKDSATKDLTEFFEGAPHSDKEFINLIKKQYKIKTIDSCRGAVLFGAKKSGKKILSIFKKLNIQVSAFSDNDKKLWGHDINGLKVLSPSDLKKNSEQMVIITSKYVKQIYKQLRECGCQSIVPYYVLDVLYQKEFRDERHKSVITEIRKGRKSIEKVYSLLQDEKSRKLFLDILRFRTTLSPKYLPQIDSEQYFPGKFWRMQIDESYVDVGAYTGDTLQQFLRQVKGKFKKYYALEPDPANFKELAGNISKYVKLLNKIKIFNLGAGSSRQEVCFAFNSEGSTVVKDSEYKIKVEPLDDLCLGELVTTIKMDVEGYEDEVLAGAKIIIKSQHPKLAVCVYHRPIDLWKLPMQILKYNSGYKFYLRHHQEEMFETVLYAIPKNLD